MNRISAIGALLVALLIVGFAIWEGFQSRFSFSSRSSVLTAIGVVIVVASAAGVRRHALRSRAWLSNALASIRSWKKSRMYAFGSAVWVLLLLAAVGWDLNSFVHEVHYLPTLSFLIGRITRLRWGRALLFGIWLAAGTGLAFGHRTSRRRERRIR